MFSTKLGNTVLMLKSAVSAFSQSKIIPELFFKSLQPIGVQQSSSIKSTAVKYDLMEFFDKKENWGEQEIKVGRSWRTEELRIKSNSDLHKLWFVLLKERNMLLTMEHECKERVELFPNPERIDKVNESMSNLETVVRERNRAYFELETGHNGERHGQVFKNALGLRQFQRAREYFVPFFMNKKWRKDYYIDVHRGTAVRKFLKLYREKLSVAKRKQLTRERNHVMQILKRFPSIEEETLKKNFPNVNIDGVRYNKRTLGHHDKNEYFVTNQINLAFSSITNENLRIRLEMTPFDDFMYLINSVLLGEEPTIEDFILLIGTFVAFVAFVLWCCFPVIPKEATPPAQYDRGQPYGGRRGPDSSLSSYETISTVTS